MSSSRLSTCRIVCAWLLALLSVGAALEIHPEGETLEFASAGQTIAVPTLGHPVTTTHVEASTLREVPLCPVCLLRLQTRGVRLAAAARVALPTLAARIVTAGAQPHAWRPGRPSSGRAPPLA